MKLRLQDINGLNAVAFFILMILNSCFSGAALSENISSQQQKKQKGDVLNPVTDAKPPGHVPKPSVFDYYIGIGSGAEPIDPPTSDAALGPLPLPSMELGEVLPDIYDTLGRPPEFDPLVLSDLRKKVNGAVIYGDGEHNLWRVEPKKSGPAKMFRGSHPFADPARGRIVYVDWDIKYIYVCIFDFRSSMRSTVYSGVDPVVRPSLSPDGKYVAFIVKSMSGEGTNLYRVDLRTKAVRVLTKNVSFASYSWDPSDSSIWITVRSCPDDAPRGNFCYGRIDPASGKTEFNALSVRYPAGAERVPIDSFGKPAINFSPDGRLLIYDAEETNDFFFEVDMKTRIAEKHSFKKPDGNPILPRNLQWGPCTGCFSMELKRNVWVKVPGVEQPFPVTGNFSTAGPAAWMP